MPGPHAAVHWLIFFFFFLNLLPQLTTLRGAILEDAIPSTARHGTARGLPLKEVLEYVIPELNIQCLRLAINSPKVPEQLLKLDEQGVSSVQVCLHETEVQSPLLGMMKKQHVIC